MVPRASLWSTTVAGIAVVMAVASCAMEPESSPPSESADDVSDDDAAGESFEADESIFINNPPPPCYAACNSCRNQNKHCAGSYYATTCLGAVCLDKSRCGPAPYTCTAGGAPSRMDAQGNPGGPFRAIWTCTDPLSAEPVSCTQYVTDLP